VLGESGLVLRGHVPLVLVEAVQRKTIMEVDHQPVPGDLGEHAGRRHTGRHLVALPDGQPRQSRARERKAVGEDVVRAFRQRRHGPAHGREVAHVQATGVDLRGGDDHHGVRERALDHLGVDPFPGRRREQLRVGQALDLPALALRQHRRRGHQRTGAGATAGLVGTGDEPEAASLQRTLKCVKTTLPAYDGAGRGQHVSTDLSTETRSAG
jgi:hypothetical protein